MGCKFIKKYKNSDINTIKTWKIRIGYLKYGKEVSKLNRKRIKEQYFI